MRKVWMRLGNDKYLAWASIIGLLLASVVSASTMPFSTAFLLTAAWAIVFVATSKKREQG